MDLLGYPEYADALLIFSHGWTSIGFMQFVLIKYLDGFGNISDDLFSLLYDDSLFLLLEDMTVPESELTQEQKDYLRTNDQLLRGRMFEEFQIIRGIAEDFDRRYSHLHY